MPQVKVYKEVAARKDNFFFILSCRHLRVSTILLNTHTHTQKQAHTIKVPARVIYPKTNSHTSPQREYLFFLWLFYIPSSPFGTGRSTHKQTTFNQS